MTATTPKFLRPSAMLMIAGGFLFWALFARSVKLWMIPILMLPISIGSSIFNPINNATVMSALPLRHRGIASGMLETTREMGPRLWRHGVGHRARDGAAGRHRAH